jgi:aspartokinase
MSEQLVAKAGGTSNSTASAVEQSLTWAEQADIFVVSAPGRLEDDGSLEASKVTKLLKESRRQYLANGIVSSEISDVITARYELIALGLGRATVSSHWIDAIRPRVEESVRHSADAASMLGERLQAEIYESLGFRLLDPGRSTQDLGSDPDKWKDWLSTEFVKGQRHVMPGNTTRANGRLVTFGDGGSDISGGLAAYGIDAGLNLNLTDDCAKSADPNLIARERLKPISHMLYV